MWPRSWWPQGASCRSCARATKRRRVAPVHASDFFMGHGKALKCECCSDKQCMGRHSVACGHEVWSVCRSGLSQRRPAFAKG